MEELAPLDINGNKKAWAKYKKKEFKEGKIEGLSKHNSEIIIALLKNLEEGINCTSRGMRTPASLLRNRRTARVLAKRCKNKDFDKLTREEISRIIKKENSEDFARNVKVIFRWMHRVGRMKENITEHILPTQFSKGKPPWVYLGEEDTKRLINALNSDYRALATFILDSGVRPEEAWRIRVFDFQEDFTILDLPEVRSNGERVVKKHSFERKIKLKLCSQLMKEYVEREQLNPTDLIFTMTQAGFNKALRMTCKKLFGKETIENGEKKIICEPTKGRESPDKMTAYDLRHIAACFWLKRYKTNRDLMYRFGWKTEERIFYYSEFLDMRDTIDDEDLITKEDKIKMENRIKALEKIVFMLQKNDGSLCGEEKEMAEELVQTGRCVKTKNFEGFVS